MDHVILYMNRNAAAKSVMLQLHAQHKFCKIIFKIKHKIKYGLRFSHRHPQ